MNDIKEAIELIKMDIKAEESAGVACPTLNNAVSILETFDARHDSEEVERLKAQLSEAVELLRKVRHKPSVLNPIWEKIFIFLSKHKYKTPSSKK